MNTLIPFSSRAEAVRLSRALGKKRIAHTVLNTPRKLGVSCGLSVLFYETSLESVQQTINELGLRTMQGIFRR
ncbi:MAG: DUF3343 domain-containing protein [Clostridia bacterium]|nr:DUF3343 domain-containing protein [Clostridia bacterium]